MHNNFPEGYIQIYTGGGKGKTTAAIGVTMRATASDMSVFFGQFMKNTPSSEHIIFDAYPSITYRQFGTGCFVCGRPGREDAKLAEAGWQTCKDAILSGAYDLVVMDELCVTLWFGLLNEAEVIETLKNKPKQTEVILTGRNASEGLIGIAHLVTEMQEIKHYFQIGVPARKGIEE
jgi:cob(I)alamin adenosyltransferase